MRNIAFFLLVSCLLFLTVACHSSPLEDARTLVNIGDLRKDVIKLLNEEAWYHQPCEYQDSITDLFFYGERHYDKADIVIITSILENGEYRVRSIGSFEPYVWHAVYGDCIDRDQFEDRLE